jgi:hypothetical protein
MVTTEVSSDQLRWIHFYLSTNEFPSFVDVGFGPSNFQVVHVHDEKEFKFGMEITRAPILNGGEAQRQEMAIAVLFPIAPRIRMTVQGQNQRAYWVTKLGP